MDAEKYLNWRRDETRELKFTYERKGTAGADEEHMVTLNVMVPAAYHMLACQLLAEISFAVPNDLHEARRRQLYARKVLDLFGQELDGLTGYSETAMKGFRSKVLTPLLAQQLSGTDDAYHPSVEMSIRGDHPELTIEVVTEFYLKEDPTDPKWLPVYRRNLLYVPMSRWYVGRLMKGPPTPEYYKLILKNHDIIMKSLARTGLQGEDDSEDGIPLLTDAEVTAITQERLHIFYRNDLERLVRTHLLS